MCRAVVQVPSSGSRLASSSAPRESAGARGGKCIGKITALKRCRGTAVPERVHAEAISILGRVAAQVEPIMRKRSWRVGHVAEFCPKDGRLLGMNVNVGEKILIRLRKSAKSMDIMCYEDILGTMLHELAHMEVGPHNAKFRKLLDELTAECEELMMSGVNYANVEHVPFEGEGKVVGGARRSQSGNSRQIAAEAAERRRRVGSLYGRAANGVKLGGSSASGEGISPRTLRLRAAQSRLWQRFSQSCQVVDRGARVRETPRSGPKRERSMWTCSICTLRNKAMWLQCDACGREKPSDLPPMDAAGASSPSRVAKRGRSKAATGTAENPIEL